LWALSHVVADGLGHDYLGADVKDSDTVSPIESSNDLEANSL